MSFGLDSNTADRLVAGSIDTDDAAPEYGAVVETLRALRRPPEPAELRGEAESVARITRAVVLATRDDRARRPRRSPSPLVLVVAAVAAGLTLTSGLAAAGALGPAQRVVSTGLDKVGISVPSGEDNSKSPEVPSTTPGTGRVTPGDPGSSPANASNAGGAPAVRPDKPEAVPAAGGAPHAGTGSSHASEAGGAAPSAPKPHASGEPRPDGPSNPSTGHGPP